MGRDRNIEIQRHFFSVMPDLQELGSVFHIETHLPSSTWSNFASAVSLFFNSISSDPHRKVKMHCFHYHLLHYLFRLRKCA